MKRLLKIIFGGLLVFTQTVSIQASENEQFKSELLEQIKNDLPDMDSKEIQEIINTVENQIQDYIEHYEETPQNELLTKEELLLSTKKKSRNTNNFEEIAKAENKPVEQAMLENLNPKLNLLPDNSYYYNEETKELEFDITKEEIFAASSNPLARSAWSLLEKGDVLINFDNGSSGLRWGHVAFMQSKGPDPFNSYTYEAPGSGQVVGYRNYETVWHNNTWDRMTYNYVPRIYGSGKAAAAANNALQYHGKKYSLTDSMALGNTSSIYCTELVFLAYLSQGVNLGNGMNSGSIGILFPRSMYCDADLMYYFRQNVGGGMC